MKDLKVLFGGRGNGTRSNLHFSRKLRKKNERNEIQKLKNDVPDSFYYQLFSDVLSFFLTCSKCLALGMNKIELKRTPLGGVGKRVSGGVVFVYDPKYCESVDGP